MANLEKANLWQADLRETTLVGANLREANLGLARLEGASLHNADLRKVYLGNADLRKTWLGDPRRDLPYIELHSSRLKGFRFQLTNHDGATLSDADVTDSKVRKQQLLHASTLRSATLPDGTELSDDTWSTELEEWTYEGAVWEDDGKEIPL